MSLMMVNPFFSVESGATIGNLSYECAIVRGWSSSSQFVDDAVTADLKPDRADFGDGGFTYDSSTGEFTVPSSVSLVLGIVSYRELTGDGNTVRLDVNKNGTLWTRQRNNKQDWGELTFRFVMAVTSGDTISFSVYSDRTFAGLEEISKDARISLVGYSG